MKQKIKYYVLVDNGHNEFSKWDAFTLKEAQTIKRMLYRDMLLNDLEIVKVVR